jgi:hypothetical protein
MQRTPPPGPSGHQQTAHPSRTDHQEHARDSLYPPIDDDELDSPSRHENITPVAQEQGPSLSDLMAAINALRAEGIESRRQAQEHQRQIQETQRQVQDLNALFIRTNSPPNRDQSPAAMRRPSPPPREPRYGTAPPDQ